MLEIKKDPYLLAFAGLLVVCATTLVWHGDLTLKEAGSYLMAALLSPGLVGRKAGSTGVGDVASLRPPTPKSPLAPPPPPPAS